MPSEPSSFLPFAGLVRFPRRSEDLTDTSRCPACFSPLTSTVCNTCGLDVAHPSAVELSRAGTETAALLRRRLELIGRIRWETARSTAPDAPAAAPIAAERDSAPSGTIASAAPPSEPAAPAAGSAPPPAAASTTPNAVAPRRHLGVQVVLLIVGSSLLAIGAIFFLVYAFITFGLVWRSAIIAAVTIAAIVGATILRRRRLRATAEAIAALAVVLVYLDVFAVRANGLFGADAAQTQVYWGVALLLSAVGFASWHRMSALRIPNLVAFAAVAPGLALAVAGATEPLDAAQRVFWSGIGAAIGALAHLAPRSGRMEQMLALGFGTLGLLAAGAASVAVAPDVEWAAAPAALAVAGVAVAHAAIVIRRGGPRPFGPVFAGIAAAAAVGAGTLTAIRVGESGGILIAALGATTVVLVAEAAVRRRRMRTTRIGLWTAATLAALAALPALGAALSATAATSLSPLTEGVWTVSQDRRLVATDWQLTGLATVAAALVLIVLIWGAEGVLRRRRLAVLAPAKALVVLAVPLVGVLAAAVAVWAALAVLAAITLVVARGWSRGLRLSTAGIGVLALLSAYGAAWSSEQLWWIGGVAAVGSLTIARWSVAAGLPRAVLLAGAFVAATVLATVAAERANQLLPVATGALDGSRAAILLAAIVVGLLAAARGLAEIERRVLFWLAVATGVVAALMLVTLAGSGTTAGILDPAPATLLVGGAATAATIAYAVRGVGSTERVAAAALVAPALGWLGATVAETTGILTPTDATSIAAALATLVAGAALALRAPHRLGWDAGASATAAIAVLTAAIGGSALLWFTLLLAAAVALVIALSADGLMRSASSRRHLGWLALVLAIAALWLLLAEQRVDAVEASVLPVAGALLLLAAALWRSARPGSSRVAPVVVAAALGIGLLPLAVTAIDGDEVRAIVVGFVAALLAIAGSAPASAAARRYLDAAAAVGALSVAVAAFGRAGWLASSGARDDVTTDLWLLGGAVVLGRVAWSQARLPDRGRATLSQGVLIVALSAVALVESAMLESDALGTVRTLAVLLILGAVHVLSVVTDRIPFSRPVGWVAIGFAAAVAAVGLLRDAVDPIEIATATLAAALLVAGALRLRTDPRAGSWPWLAPGLAVLLLPSLAATFVDDAPWRLVALGAAGIAAIVVGALGRLQAPLLLGATVVLVHGIRTFAPQLRAIYESTEWWVWAVVGGAIIVFLGFTIERRIRDLRAVTSRVSALR